MNRRNFLQAAAFAAAGVALGGGIPTARAAQGAPSDTVSDILRGVSDIHIHAAPDVRDRLEDELTLSREAMNAGYRCVMFKSNEWSCHDRAYLVRKALPDFECFGSLCMNRVHGDRVNVHAAEMAVKTTGNYCRCIWMPTQAAAYQHRHDKLSGEGIPVLSHNGEVLPEVVRVMEICAEANIIFATGHCSPEESIVLAEKAREVGMAKFVVTHANSHIWKMTHDQIRKVIDLGGMVEYSYITNLWGPGTGLPTHTRLSDEEFVAFAKINPERSFITTDLGQVDMPHPLEGMRRCIMALLNAGIPQADVDRMLRINPANLVNLASEGGK
ncbi:MAG: DUF6282 family protein [Planctomycetes bacterium]|nr:DUF6282 family protein [Planctomycetota bacterium]